MSGELTGIPTTTIADLVGRAQVMDNGIRALWPGAPSVAGPAFTVRCPPGDNLMVHAAIHRAGPGTVVVVEAGDADYAMAGGNVVAVAQRRGIAGFVVDGVVRDLGEVRELGFPVYARGLNPFPGKKNVAEPLNQPVRCGGVGVAAGDLVFADEEGIVVVPAARADDIVRDARAVLAAEAEVTLDQWEAEHRQRIDTLLAERGFDG